MNSKLVEIVDLNIQHIASICDHTFLCTVDSFKGQKDGAIIKLILETSALNKKQIKSISELANNETDVDFIKTSTGFGKYGATVENLKIMRENFSRGIKISGGVNTKNVGQLLSAAVKRDDGYIDLNPMKIRIGESGLLKK